MVDVINIIATVIFDGDPKALSDLAKSQSDWLAFYRLHGDAMLVDVDYLEEIGGPGKVEMVLHIGSMHGYVCNADWRDFADDFAEGIRGLKRYGDRKIDWDDFLDGADEFTTNDFMHRLAGQIDTEQETLVIVDMASDSYDFAIVDTDLIESLDAAVQETGDAQLHVVKETEFSD